MVAPFCIPTNCRCSISLSILGRPFFLILVTLIGVEVLNTDSNMFPKSNLQNKGVVALQFFVFCFFLNQYFFFFLAVLGLRFCARAFSSCGERGPLFTAVRGPLTVAASLVAEHRLQTCRLGSCGSWA